MLSLDDNYYRVPEKAGQGWKVRGEGEVRFIQQPFNYTMHGFTFDGVKYEGKFTFIYDGASVRPNSRTLRVYGAEMLQPIVSALSLQKHSEEEDQLAEEPASEKGASLDLSRLMSCKDRFDLEILKLKYKAAGEWNSDVETAFSARALELGRDPLSR